MWSFASVHLFVNAKPPDLDLQNRFLLMWLVLYNVYVKVECQGHQKNARPQDCQRTPHWSCTKRKDLCDDHT